jgi:beta-galactosidase
VFTEMAGVTAKSNLDLIENSGGNADLEISFSGNDTIFRPRTILESLTLHGAEAIATFRGGRMSGRPAITRHRHGQGWVFYVGTDSADNGFHETLARAVGVAGNLSPLIAAPYGVEVVSRENSETNFYFLLNLTEAAHDNIELPWPMEDLIAGKASVAKVSLGPLEVAVLASPKVRR